MKKLARPIYLMLTLCAFIFLWNEPSYAQNVPIPAAPVATVVETLPDGQGYVVKINGIEHRALSPDASRKLAARLQAGDEASRERDLLQAENKLLKDLSNSLARQLDITGKQLERERQISKSFENLYLAEKDLREKAVKLVGKKSKTSIILENAARVVSVATFILSTVK